MRLAYEHIVFDLDGTLVDSLADLGAAVNHVRARLGLPPLSLATVRDYVGEGARRLVERALGPDYRERWAEGLTWFMDYYGAHLLDHTRAYEGIADALAALAARRVVLSVLTNKPEAMSRKILEGLGLLPRFAAVLGDDSLAARKPDPAGIEQLRCLTNSTGARLLMVGDSLIDARTAEAAGVPFCGVAWGFASAALAAAGRQPIISTPNELVRMVDG